MFSQNTVALIDALVLQIKEDQNTYEKVEKINSEQGYRWVYYQDGKPRMIVVQEQGRIEKNVTWYFNKQKLIYTETNHLDSTDGKIVHQEKTYHSEDAMIAWIDNENSFVDATSPEFIALDKTLRAYANKIYLEAIEE